MADIIAKNSIPKKPWRGQQVFVKWPGRKLPLTITIFPHTESRTEDEPKDMKEVIRWYEVNWSALGSVPADDAVHYASAILMAASIAKRLTARFGGQEWR